MRTTISVSLAPREAQKTRTLARRRGFESVSGYLRFLLSSDDIDLISEDELVRLSKSADILYKQGKLIRAKSSADFLK